MPDDSAPALRTSQTDHAKRVRDERALMRVSGASRSQVRRALAGWAAERLEAQQIKALEGIPTRPRETVITSETQAFEPQPLTLGEIPGQGTGGTVTPPVEEVADILMVTIVQDPGTGAFTQETISVPGEIV